MLDLNPNLHPPGGFFYVCPDGIELRADSLAALVLALADYRTNAGLLPGDPRREIAEQICNRSPHVCHEVVGIPSGPTAEQKAFIARVVKSTNELTKAKLAFAKSAEAYARANTCIECPHKKEWARHCTPCSANAKQILKDIVAPRELVSTVAGSACALAGDDLSVAVWVENGKRLNDAPSNCWRSKSENT